MEWLMGPLSGKTLVAFAVFACHFLGDFAFQGEWIATGKKESLEVNAYHASTHTGTFILLWLIPGIQIPPIAIILLVLSHFFIDLLKGYLPAQGYIRWPQEIWVDQLLHGAVYLILLTSDLITLQQT